MPKKTRGKKWRPKKTKICKIKGCFENKTIYSNNCSKHIGKSFKGLKKGEGGKKRDLKFVLFDYNPDNFDIDAAAKTDLQTAISNLKVFLEILTNYSKYIPTCEEKKIEVKEFLTACENRFLELPELEKNKIKFLEIKVNELEDKEKINQENNLDNTETKKELEEFQNELVETYFSSYIEI